MFSSSVRKHSSQRRALPVIPKSHRRNMVTCQAVVTGKQSPEGELDLSKQKTLAGMLLRAMTDLVQSGSVNGKT